MSTNKKTDKLMLADLTKMAAEKPEQLILLAKQYNRLEENAKVAQDKYKESHQSNGKVIHVLKSEWITAREKGGKLLTSATYPEHHESITGGKPTRRGYQCAVTFGLLVVTTPALISEQDYDDCPCELITLCSEIIGKANNKIDHPAVIEAAEILRRRPKTGIKDLKAIKARFVEKTEGEGENEKTTVEFVSAEEAEKMVRNSSQLDIAQTLGDLLVSGQCGAIMSFLLAHARTTEKADDVRQLVHGVINMRPALEANVDPKTNERRFDEATLEAMRNEIVPAVKKDLAYYKAQWLEVRAKQAEIETTFAELGKPELLEQWLNESEAAVASEPEPESVPAQS